MKIAFTGGGTLGPVTPLLAVLETARKDDPTLESFWIGTAHGPEQELIASEKVIFYALPVARLPRYLSVEWILLPFRFLVALVKAWWILKKEKPSMIASAGGYTAVPVIVIAWFLGIPVWVHQQDVSPLLTNLLTAPFATVVTTAFEKSMKRFPQAITQHLGNPVRPSVLKGSKERAIAHFHLDPTLPTVLVFGGGGGASWLNHAFLSIGADLSKKANIIHLTGKGKMLEPLLDLGDHYHAQEFLKEEMADVLAVAELVITRAGMGTITELSALGKASIIIPLPESPQEANAKVIEKAGAAMVLFQEEVSAEEVKDAIFDLLQDQTKRQILSDKMRQLLPTDCAKTLLKQMKF
ncbi:hypothetical protein A2239_03265 [Candidatus Uhrbacteria bacterium RIFOXYA2_FULL_40_9]|nr:MAG: UDP-diphospho-muramoylpentapeptide beta-N- acetylglucosaminyltransferase [Candidatus Uhrbacteria bacterium GW2011_GWF2_40_263]OGL94303.1 MAG: hypothetical protein A2239_03265 [Candidatus Uhrbacteria bacterium RIFOXYA2_FULL_40_9]OGL96524.1 MAG: hypothetical protein A2332_00910 [Candidatus Uhrbacteria bacterium RIFOXYB2_FULL_41_18]HBK35049.1 hypothetical protein [Candidatus Uhrbacteria bacterium]HCB55594.1 hypothetical protein [Candidatus Uhrbacteria bacterium]